MLKVESVIISNFRFDEAKQSIPLKVVGHLGFPSKVVRLVKLYSIEVFEFYQGTLIGSLVQGGRRVGRHDSEKRIEKEVVVIPYECTRNLSNTLPCYYIDTMRCLMKCKTITITNG